MKEKEKLNAYKIAYGNNTERKCTGHSAAPPHVLAISNATRERWYFNVQSKADTSQLNLPHGTNNKKVENRRTEKLTKTAKCSEVSVNGLVNPEKKNLEKKKRRLRWGTICRKGRF